MRCNNREFRLTRLECRKVLLYAIQKCKDKYGFKLYALCIMSNHIHYLLEPLQPEDLPKIMHWLNWYTAMCFNRMMNRTGHFWEKRYHSNELLVLLGFPPKIIWIRRGNCSTKEIENILRVHYLDIQELTNIESLGLLTLY